MLSKSLLVAALIAAPVYAAPSDMRAGKWPDGAEIVWQCSAKMPTTAFFAFKLPDGNIYQGQLYCGDTV